MFILLSWSLYRQIISQPDLAHRWSKLKVSWQEAGTWIVLVLMFANWGVESLKWKLSVAFLERISFLKAFKSVLSGCSVTMLTPNRMGEYGGRILYLHENNRLNAISITILGSLSQLMITMILGCISLVIISADHLIITSDGKWLMGKLLFSVSAILTILLILIYFRIGKWVLWLQRLPFTQSFVKHVIVISSFKRKLLLRMLFLSFLRYMIFILQYVIMLQVMEVDIPLKESFLLIAVFYMVMAIAPTVGFIELPVRAVASVQVFGILSFNTIGIQAATLGIWLINLVLPAVIGSLLIFGIKILKEK